MRKPAVIKLALPAGDIRGPVAELLEAAGLRVEGYGEGSRSYRLSLPDRDEVTVRVFREKDIPVQVALGSYDLGVCNLAWVAEMRARFPEQPIVSLRDLEIGRCGIYAASAQGVSGLADLSSLAVVRMASDYPNLADAFAAAARFPAYRVQAIWGAAEAYPPEDADVVVVAVPDEGVLRERGLVPLFRLLEGSAWLIANADSLAKKDLSSVLGSLMAGASEGAGAGGLCLPPPLPAAGRGARRPPERSVVRMALPDGHQQRHVVEALTAAGLEFEGYDESRTERRPVSPMAGLEIKVIRPHDMPQLVATGEIDLAVTGRDCLLEHLYRFPSSPVEEIQDLQRGQYNLSAVVSEELPVSTIGEALDLWRSPGKTALRIAAEYPGLADHYARSRHLWRYQIIPIAGASEGYVPEDADLLIEGTETGKTLAENGLKVIDLLFRSTTCVIARKGAALSGRRREVFDELVAALRRSAEAVEPV